LLAFGLPLLLAGLVLLWHNLVRFGHPLASGYDDEGFTTPLYVGLYGLLFSTGKSIFLYTPISLLALPAYRVLWRRRPAETLLASGSVLVTLLYYGAWWAWYGGWCWGPRFLVPVLPLLVLPLGALLIERRWSRWVVLVLALAGLVVQLLGTLVDFNPYIVEITGSDPANEARYLFLPWLSPLVGHLGYLVKGQYLTVASFTLDRLGFTPLVALLFPVLSGLTLAGSLLALVILFRPQRRRSGGMA
jgi:hypothetical protein